MQFEIFADLFWNGDFQAFSDQDDADFELDRQCFHTNHRQLYLRDILNDIWYGTVEGPIMARKIVKAYLTPQQTKLLERVCSVLGISEAECLRMGLWELTKVTERLLSVQWSGGTGLIMTGAF